MSKINLAKPKRSSGGMGAGGVIALVVVVAILVGAAVFFIPRLTHTCDHCGEFFFGTGYRANIISNTLTDIAGKKDKVLCVDCAVKEHALAIARKIKAMMAENSGSNKLSAKPLTVMKKSGNDSDKLFVPNDSDISMWKFHWADEDRCAAG